jgi:hypothetical protein
MHVSAQKSTNMPKNTLLIFIFSVSIFVNKDFLQNILVRNYSTNFINILY